MFDRTKPCKSCPFRTGPEALRFLGRDRAEDIVESLVDRQQTFTCHDDIGLPERKRQHCVGAMIMLEAVNRPNQMMRISERLGGYDRTKLTGQEEVFDNFDDWVDCQEV